MLSPGDCVFVREYCANGFNKVQAYLKAHPKSKYRSASVSACRKLEKPDIISEIKLHMASLVLTKEDIVREITKGLQYAWDNKKMDAHARYLELLGKFRGDYVTKTQDVTDEPVYSEAQIIEELRKRTRPPVPSAHTPSYVN